MVGASERTRHTVLGPAIGKAVHAGSGSVLLATYAGLRAVSRAM